MKKKQLDLALRDWAGVVLVVLLATGLVAIAFITHAGPIILIAVLILLVFAFSRYVRERGREAESADVAKALRTRLHKGEQLRAFTVGDRRRFKPMAVLGDLVLMVFSQGLAAGGRDVVAGDDTFVGLTDRRVIAIDRRKRPSGAKRTWRDRLNLTRIDDARGRYEIVFETSRRGLDCSVNLAVFWLARLTVRTDAGQAISVGLNSRYWSERALELSQAINED